MMGAKRKAVDQEIAKLRAGRDREIADGIDDPMRTAIEGGALQLGRDSCDR